jgi:hypothetical protein
VSAAATKARGSAARDLQLARADAHQDFMSQSGKTLADLSDEQFEEGLRRVKVMHDRVEKAFASILREGVHYGNPEENGQKKFKKPMLYEVGAQALRTVVRLSVRHMDRSPTIEHSGDYVTVVVQMGIFDAVGRLIATRAAACNTTEEVFRSSDGAGWLYDDARSEIHHCLTTAEKRCATLLTKEATGATEFFTNEEQIPCADEDRDTSRMTDEEKRTIVAAALARRMNRGQLEKLVIDVLGRLQVGTGAEVKKVLGQIAKWEPPAKKTGEAPTPAAPATRDTSFDEMPEALADESDALGDGVPAAEGGAS